MKQLGTFARTTLAVATVVLAVPAAGAAQGRPFGAGLEGHANPVQTGDPCVLTNSEEGEGRATHMGRITWASAETVNFCTNPGGADVRGEFVMRAANGDEVSGRYVTLAQLDFQTGVITFGGTWTIDGGTGRFTGAFGEGRLSGEGALNPPFAVIASFVGTIYY